MTDVRGRVLVVGAVAGPGPDGPAAVRALAADWDVREAGSVHTALEHLAAFDPDVVVLPWHGPAVAESEFLAEVHRRDPGIGRLVLVADGDIEAAVPWGGPACVYAAPRDGEVSGRVAPGALAAAVATAAAARAVVVSGDLLGGLGGIEALPRQPSVYAEILDVTGRPDTGIPDVVAVIERDVIAVSELLRVVNSAYFGMPTHVDSVERAVTLIGLEMVEALAVASAVFGRTGTTAPDGVDLAAVARRGLRVGTAARRIAQEERWSGETRSHAFVAGLLHEVGLLAVAGSRPADLPRLTGVREAVVDARDAAEADVLGWSVCETSAVLLKSWGFGPGVVQILAGQRAAGPASAYRTPVAQAVAVARHLATAGIPQPYPPAGAWLTEERLARWVSAADAARADDRRRNADPDIARRPEAAGRRA